MTKRMLLIGGASAAALSFATPVSAAPILFELTGSRTATFTIDSDTIPTTQSSSAFGDQISYSNVTGSFGGASSATVGFGTGVFAALNITGTPLGFTQFASATSLFTLVNNRPVFNFGSFALTSIVSGSSTLRISAVTAAVPEPATWAMMLVGFGLVGGAARYRRRQTNVTYAV